MADYEELRLRVALADDASAGLAKLRTEIRQIGSGESQQSWFKFGGTTREVTNIMRPLATGALNVGSAFRLLGGAMGPLGIAAAGAGYLVANQLSSLNQFSGRITELNRKAESLGVAGTTFTNIVKQLQTNMGLTETESVNFASNFASKMGDLMTHGSKLRNQLMQVKTDQAGMMKWLARITGAADSGAMGEAINEWTEGVNNAFEETLKNTGSRIEAANVRASLLTAWGVDPVTFEKIKGQFRDLTPEEEASLKERIRLATEYERQYRDLGNKWSEISTKFKEALLPVGLQAANWALAAVKGMEAFDKSVAAHGESFRNRVAAIMEGVIPPRIYQIAEERQAEIDRLKAEIAAKRERGEEVSFGERIAEVGGLQATTEAVTSHFQRVSESRKAALDQQMGQLSKEDEVLKRRQLFGESREAAEKSVEEARERREREGANTAVRQEAVAQARQQLEQIKQENLVSEDQLLLESMREHGIAPQPEETGGGAEAAKSKWYNPFSWGKRQQGGPVGAGSPYLVGEGGPEMFVPGEDGTIIPNQRGGLNIESGFEGGLGGGLLGAFAGGYKSALEGEAIEAAIGALSGFVGGVGGSEKAKWEGGVHWGVIGAGLAAKLVGLGAGGTVGSGVARGIHGRKKGYTFGQTAMGYLPGWSLFEKLHEEGAEALTGEGEQATRNKINNALIAMGIGEGTLATGTEQSAFIAEAIENRRARRAAGETPEDTASWMGLLGSFGRLGAQMLPFTPGSIWGGERRQFGGPVIAGGPSAGREMAGLTRDNTDATEAQTTESRSITQQLRDLNQFFQRQEFEGMGGEGVGGGGRRGFGRFLGRGGVAGGGGAAARGGGGGLPGSFGGGTGGTAGGGGATGGYEASAPGAPPSGTDVGAGTGAGAGDTPAGSSFGTTGGGAVAKGVAAGGNFQNIGGAKGVDPRLTEILKETAAQMPEGWKAEVRSGVRAGGGTSYHGKAAALDIALYDPEGAGKYKGQIIGKLGTQVQAGKGAVPWLQTPQGFKTYQAFAEKAYEVALKKYGPEVAAKLSWGGYFKSGPAFMDLMHFSLGGEGQGAGKLGQGLKPEVAKAWGIDQALPSQLKFATSRQYGGPVSPGTGPFVVGESGPELFFPAGPGQILSRFAGGGFGAGGGLGALGALFGGADALDTARNGLDIARNGMDLASLLMPAAIQTSGRLDVNVNAPKGTTVSAQGGGLFKNVIMNRVTQMMPPEARQVMGQLPGLAGGIG